MASTKAARLGEESVPWLLLSFSIQHSAFFVHFSNCFLMLFYRIWK
jgi:hypothetical protein